MTEQDNQELYSTDTDDRKKINWHRLFGMTLVDFFDNTAYEVEIEKKLVLDQFIDIVIVKKESGGTLKKFLMDLIT